MMAMATRKAPAQPATDEFSDFAAKLRRALEEGWAFHATPQAERDKLRPAALQQIACVEAAMRKDARARGHQV